MTDPLLAIFGTFVVALVFYDFLRTTISLSGLGFLSRWLTAGLWHVGSRAVLRCEALGGPSFRGAFGPCILAAIAGMWILVHLVGYTLLYRSGPSLVESGTAIPASLIQTFAFVGSALSTLGASTVSVTGAWWDILSMVAAINGMIVLTLSVSFVLNVLQTTLSARTFATRYHALRSKGPFETDVEVLGRVAVLGPDLTSIVVRLTASPLLGVFVPSDQKMDFPAVVLELCDLLERQGLRSREEQMSGVDVSEMRWAIGLLGRHMKTSSSDEDLVAARKWADRYSLGDRKT